MEALRAVLPDPSLGGLIFHQKLVIEKKVIVFWVILILLTEKGNAQIIVF